VAASLPCIAGTRLAPCTGWGAAKSDQVEQRGKQVDRPRLLLYPETRRDAGPEIRNGIRSVAS
jgi:hypothetical protein